MSITFIRLLYLNWGYSHWANFCNSDHKLNLLAASYSINELHIAQEEQFLGWFHHKVPLFSPYEQH